MDELMSNVTNLCIIMTNVIDKLKSSKTCTLKCLMFSQHKKFLCYDIHYYKIELRDSS